MPRSSSTKFGLGQAGINVCAALDTLAFSEIGPAMLAQSDDGYNVLVGSVPGDVHTFPTYAFHPNVKIWLPKLKDFSTAAGRYQTLWKYADAYIKQLHLPGFDPVSQDAIAVQQMRECHAVAMFMDGKFEDGITACRSRWASLPGAGYGQHENAMEALRGAFQAAGGVIR